MLKRVIHRYADLFIMLVDIKTFDIALNIAWKHSMDHLYSNMETSPIESA